MANGNDDGDDDGDFRRRGEGKRNNNAKEDQSNGRIEEEPSASLFGFESLPNSQPGGNDGGGDENVDGPLLPPRRRTSERKLKNVVKFDPRPLPGRRADDYAEKETKVCRVGEGFACPRCCGVCSYDARSCLNCNLECYYEAGVGAVTLKERNDLAIYDFFSLLFPHER